MHCGLEPDALYSAQAGKICQPEFGFFNMPFLKALPIQGTAAYMAFVPSSLHLPVGCASMSHHNTYTLADTVCGCDVTPTNKMHPDP